MLSINSTSKAIWAQSLTILVLILFLFCVLLASCKKINPVPSEPFHPSPPPLEKETSMMKMENFEINSALKNDYEFGYTEFYIGDEVYLTKSGHELPYKVRGIIAAPNDKGPFPLVLIAHGNHEEMDESRRFDTGFDYLVKAFAQNGYIALSMDMLAPYIQRYGGNDDYVEKMLPIVDAHMQALTFANSGDDLYSIDLTGKIDFKNIVLLGHSRSGSAMFQVAKDQLDKGLGIKAMLSLAPASDLWIEFSDIPTSFLIPQYDGDLVQLEGIFMFDYLADRVCGDHSLTLLMGANHNFFNRNLECDDFNAEGLTDAHPQLSRTEQEEFLIKYAIDFFDASLGVEDRFYHQSEPQPNKMYGYNINRQLRFDLPTELININNTESFFSENASISTVTDSVFFQEDEVLVNTGVTSILKTVLDGSLDRDNPDLEFIAVNRELIYIEWEQKDVEIDIKPLISNFSDKTAMTIQIIPDSASELNSPDESISFTICLRDDNGNEASVQTADEQWALTCYPGQLRTTQLTEDFTIEYWSPTTPLGMLNIPLSYFDAVDLTFIESIHLIFDGNNSGAIFIASWQLQ